MSFTQPRLHHHQVRYVMLSYQRFTYSTVVLQCYRRQAIPKYGASQNSTIRNFVFPEPIIIKRGVIDYVGHHYSYTNFGWIWLGGEFPANTWNILTSLWLFVVSLFFVHSSGAKTRERICTIEGSKRMKLGKDVPFGGFVKNYYPHPQYPEIWREVVLWPFLRMRSIRLARTTWNLGPISEIFRQKKSGTEKSNFRSNFTPQVVLWPLLRMRTKSGPKGSKPGQNSGYVRTRARRT